MKRVHINEVNNRNKQCLLRFAVIHGLAESVCVCVCECHHTFTTTLVSNMLTNSDESFPIRNKYISKYQCLVTKAKFEGNNGLFCIFWVKLENFSSRMEEYNSGCFYCSQMSK